MQSPTFRATQQQTLAPRPKPAVALVASSTWRLCWQIALLALSLACGPVRLISAYDVVTDEGTSALHSDLSAFVTKMSKVAGKPEGTHDANLDFYADVNGRLSTLRMRAAAQSKNEITVKLFAELSTSVGKLEELHVSGGPDGLSDKLGEPALQGITVICESIVKLEVAKREWREE